ncbi:MAG: hypothetical protein GXY38_02835, partial [Planctomycetes bacterium]|nr:hypothetical protein [Planctomycetota bacterium]
MNRQSSPTRAGFPFWLAHPALLGCWQVLFLYHRNMGEYPMSAMIRPAVAMAIGCSLAAFIAKTILRNAHKAGLLISLWILLAFSFGNLWAVLDGAILHVGPLSLGCKKIAALILIPPAIIGGYFILRMKIQPATAGARVSKAAAVVVGVMWIVMAAQIGLGYIRRPQAQPPFADERVAAQGPLPDIYFIVLDGYGRSDVLKERFGFDNSAFLAELADRGFGVYQNARSNYV